jgi:hypothetical protein
MTMVAFGRLVFNPGNYYLFSLFWPTEKEFLDFTDLTSMRKRCLFVLKTFFRRAGLSSNQLESEVYAVLSTEAEDGGDDK